jgi:hypothetical protein
VQLGIEFQVLKRLIIRLGGLPVQDDEPPLFVAKAWRSTTAVRYAVLLTVLDQLGSAIAAPGRQQHRKAE